MWPDKPLAPESALVGRTQLAPSRPPRSLAGFASADREPSGSLRVNLSSRGRGYLLLLQRTIKDSFFPSTTDATLKFSKAKLITKIHVGVCVCHQGCFVFAPSGEYVHGNLTEAPSVRWGWGEWIPK